MNIHDMTEEAYKNGYKAGVIEFAERLEAIYDSDKNYDRPLAHTMIVTLFSHIDNLVKEMVGE